VDDVSAWCLLALIVGVVQAAAGNAVVVVLKTAAFIAVMLTVVGPWMGRLLRRWDDDEPGDAQLAFVVAGLMIAARITEAIGVHALFGAFLFGVLVPHDSRLARTLTHRFDALLSVLLLPAFFALAGMRTHIGLLAGADAWLAFGLILAVATLGKFGGTVAAARLGGLHWRSAASLGVLMNTRGLMELIVLNVGLDLGVITPTLFTMLVLMALATTFATAPALRWLRRDPAFERQRVGAQPRQSRAGA
jgi:Kef-type K+ transport system membrane component KefB